MQLQGPLSPLFNPKSIAIIGASENPAKIGHIVLNNIMNGFKGKIFPVNPAGRNILGLDALRKVRDLPPEERPLDLAVITIPAASVPEALRDLAEVGCRTAIVISAGFKEVGGVGAQLEEEIKRLSAEHGIRLLGPNCLGLINTKTGLNATFAHGFPKPGNIGFFSQSGSLCISLLDWANSQQIGFSSFISLGNKATLDETDILSYLAGDPDTKVIVGYLESIERGPAFVHEAQMITRQKPVILMRAGNTAAGARAASSHTGALAGPDMFYEAAFKQTGIFRVRKSAQLLNLAQAFATQPLPAGPGVGVITNSGGPGIIAADACEKAGLSLSRLSSETTNKLKELLPSFAAFFNPVDIIGDTGAERLAQSVETVLTDRRVQSLLIILAPTGLSRVEDMAAAVLPVLRKYRDKPVFCCLMGGKSADAAHAMMGEAGYPCYRFPESAVGAIQAMYQYSQWKLMPLPVEVGYRRDLNKAGRVIREARENRIIELVEFQAQELFKAYEMPMLKSKLARTSEEAVQIARQFGQPVALKIASPQISHKTDVNGVVLGLSEPPAIRNAFIEITSRARRLRPEAYIAGCTVQVMAPQGSREVIVGFKRAERFGPMVVFGLGGIHVEIFKDVSCRLAPLSLEDVNSMIREIRAFPILAGHRGEKGINFNALEDVLLIMSQLAQDFPEIQEAECNPVLVSEQGAVVADMRVILSK